MPSFVNMASLTKLTSLTGNEEFQVSATQKVTATQIANKVQLNQVLMGGFEAIPINGVEKIKDTNSLIGAMKILYSLSGNGRAKVIGNSENCFGLVSINTAGTLAFGILFDIRNTTPPSIFIRDGFGLTGGASLKNLTDDQWIAELKKGEKIPMESGSGVAAPVQIAEYGAFYDYTELNNVPAGSVTAWFAPGSNVDGDLGPFKGMSEHTEGIYIAIRGSESDSYREGIMVAYRADDVEKGIAYAHVQGDPGSGGIVRQTDWMTITPGGGGASNVLHGENIVEGLEYMIPENVGDVVAFRITGDSSQVPNTTEGFGLLGKINGSESLLMAVQINPNNTYEELFYTGRVQNDGSGTDWHPIGISTANGANFPQKLLSNFTAVFDKIGEGDTLMVLMNIVGTGTAMSNGGNMVAYLQVGNSMINKEQTLYYGRDISDESIVRVLAELNSYDTDGAEFTFYTDDPVGILDATLIKVYRLPK